MAKSKNKRKAKKESKTFSLSKTIDIIKNNRGSDFTNKVSALTSLKILQGKGYDKTELVTLFNSFDIKVSSVVDYLSSVKGNITTDIDKLLSIIRYYEWSSIDKEGFYEYQNLINANMVLTKELKVTAVHSKALFLIVCEIFLLSHTNDRNFEGTFSRIILESGVDIYAVLKRKYLSIDDCKKLLPIYKDDLKVVISVSLDHGIVLQTERVEVSSVVKNPDDYFYADATDDSAIAELLDDEVETEDIPTELSAAHDAAYSKSFVLAKNDVSRIHKVIEVINNTDLSSEFSDDKIEIYVKCLKSSMPFVVKHNWLALLNSEVSSEKTEVKLPYPLCTFEFIINGCAVGIVLVEAGATITALGFLLKGGSIGLESIMDIARYRFKIPIFDFALNQVKAICIALEAKVAESTKIEASTALNKKRISTGKLPLKSYHVVDLSKKSVSSKVISEFIGTGTKKRLHFRRGHWHTNGLDKHLQWVEWQLVGNPDLGFIDKHYKL